MSTFLVLHTPVTSVPNDLAICTANVPAVPCPKEIGMVTRSVPSWGRSLGENRVFVSTQYTSFGLSL
jgi:hypothetical protein